MSFLVALSCIHVTLIPHNPTSYYAATSLIRFFILFILFAGRTIVCTIHQPNSQIFAKLDRLILLANGRIVGYLFYPFFLSLHLLSCSASQLLASSVILHPCPPLHNFLFFFRFSCAVSQVYCGPAATAVEYFESIGYPCPPRTNPADHFSKLGFLLLFCCSVPLRMRHCLQKKNSRGEFELLFLFFFDLFCHLCSVLFCELVIYLFLGFSWNFLVSETDTHQPG